MDFVANFYAFQQCKNFKNQLRFDKVTESLKVGIFFETQCTYVYRCVAAKGMIIGTYTNTQKLHKDPRKIQNYKLQSLKIS